MIPVVITYIGFELDTSRNSIGVQFNLTLCSTNKNAGVKLLFLAGKWNEKFRSTSQPS